jgi:DNA-binding transcriptional ArsR family regulator
VDDATAGDLAASVADTWGISISRASQHLQVLARAQLVDVIADGNTRIYRRASGAGEPLAAWMKDVELA